MTFSGRDLLVDLGDVSLRSRTGVRSSLRIQYVDGRGEQRDLTVGELRNGPRQVLEVPLEGCATECVLEQLYVTGSNVSVSDVQGELTIRSVEVDHRLARWHLDPGSWRPARPFPVSLVDPPVVLGAGARRGLRLELYLGRLPAGQRGAGRAGQRLRPDHPGRHARRGAGAGHHGRRAPRPRRSAAPGSRWPTRPRRSPASR